MKRLFFLYKDISKNRVVYNMEKNGIAKEATDDIRNK